MSYLTHSEHQRLNNKTMEKEKKKQVRIHLPSDFRTRMKIYSIKENIELKDLDVIALKKGFEIIEKESAIIQPSKS